MKTLILGLGKSGIAAANFAVKAGDEVTIYAGAKTEATEEAAAAFIEAGVPVIFDCEEVEGSFDLCVTSPGIPQVGDFYKSAAAASTEIISELEYAWRQSPENWVAITGTNGKSTVTSLCAHILQTSKLEATACGNLGLPVTDIVDTRIDEDEIIVAEVSSYQLAGTVNFAPKVAVLLNVTPDHESWHGSLEAYRAAKLKIFENMKPGSFAVISDDAIAQLGQDFVADLGQRGLHIVYCGNSHPGQSSCYTTKADEIFLRMRELPRKIAHVPDLTICGHHNVMNAMCAAAAAHCAGSKIDPIYWAFKSFQPLPHRIELAGMVAGARYVNDSKATNVESAVVALEAFPGKRIIPLFGGRDKGTDLTPIIEARRDRLGVNVCYGEAGPRFAAAFEEAGLKYELVEKDEEGNGGGLEAAFYTAVALTRPDDVVLLSPACASFDEFSSFEERGDFFKELVFNQSPKRVAQRQRELEAKAAAEAAAAEAAAAEAAAAEEAPEA